MVNELILNAVKEASKAHKDLPDFEGRCIEHTEKLEDFMCKMLTSSRPAKEPCPEKIGFMTQDIHVKNIEKIYHMCFLAGYQCGMSDEQRKR